MSVDIGNLCIECGKDTSIGSGLFVNRVPADNGEVDGYLCRECLPCEGCNAEPSEPCREWCLSRVEVTA